MVFITLFALAATTAIAYQEAKAEADFSALSADINNKEVMRVYRSNLEKFSESRVEARKAALLGQRQIGRTHRKALNDFNSGFAENWGQSASLMVANLARRGGEDIEQVEQNLQRELTGVDERQEETRVNIRSQLQAPEPDQSGAVLAQGLIKFGAAAASAPYQIAANNRADTIADLTRRQAKIRLGFLQVQQADLRTRLLGDDPLTREQLNKLIGVPRGY